MSINMNKKIVALSFDIEDWFTVRNMRDHFLFENWDEQELRVEIGLNFLLDELDKHNIKATFFILGWIAEKCPSIVKNISHKGHEICSHGYSHTPIDLLTPIEFEEDLRKSITILSNITGKKIKGFRAPSFSVTKETLWALDIMKNCDLEYDSSIFKISHPDYGISNFPTKITKINNFIEVPMRKGVFFGMELPVCGGGYFRLLPYFIIKSCIKQTLRKDSFVMYFHPWEFDPHQPRIGLSLFKRFRHYVGLNGNRSKFRRLLNDFEFTTIENYIAHEMNEAHNFLIEV